jgi:hypothetical protein
MTARQLNDAARRRGYQSSSRDPLKAMEKRLQDLKNQGWQGLHRLAFQRR